MRADVLPAIQGIFPPLVPPDGAVPTGEVLPDGRLVYKRRKLDVQATKATAKQKVIDGELQWRKHPTTGEKLYPIMEQKPVFKDVEFILESTHQGHVLIHENFRGTADERARDAAARAKNEFNDRLAALATERGISADELIVRLVEKVRPTAPGQVVVELPEDDEVMELDSEYPIHNGGGHWTLSDGTKMRGSKDDAMAREAELALAEAEVLEV